MCISVQCWVKNESNSVEFTYPIIAVFERISVECTGMQQISSLSPTQFTIEKSDSEWFAMTERNW